MEDKEMIYGIGVDIVEIHRIERAVNRFGMAFCRRILHEEEYALMPSSKSYRLFSWLAARFAAKEACVKALGTGFRDGISFQSIAIYKDELGKPCLRFHDRAAEVYTEKKILSAHLSLSHEKTHALAYVVLEI